MQKIIFKQKSGYATTVATSPKEIKTTDEVAKLSVPAGQPYWIVNSDDIPANDEFADIREIDESIVGEPDGYGERVGYV